MKTKYSRPATNRRKIREAPYHQRKKSFSVHLSRELRQKYGVRSLPVRKDDTVLITRGKYSGIQKKISRLSMKKRKVQIEGIKTTKTDGTEIFHYIEPSNLLLMTLGKIDDKRKKIIERNSPNGDIEDIENKKDDVKD